MRKFTLGIEPLERRDLMAFLYWDPNGATPGLGGAGIWDETVANWTTDAAGAIATQAWNNLAGDEAVFSGTGAAVTLAAGMQAASLKVEANGYTLNGGSLDINGTGEANVATGIAATISTSLVGSTELRKTGEGTLTLAGNNTLSGGSKLEAGIVALNHNSALGTGAITLAGGKLQAGNASRTLSNAVVAVAATTSEIVSPSGKNLILNGNLTGSGTVWKTGTASVFLGGDNSAFNGVLSHRAGGLYLNTADSGSELAAWDINGGVTLAANFSGDATIKFGAFSGVAGNVTSNTGSTGTKTFEIGLRNESGTFTGKFTNSTSGITAFKKIGTGTLTLTSSNTNYTGGSVIEGGTLVFASGYSLGTGTITLSGGRLQSTGGNRTLTNALVLTANTTNEIISSLGSNLTLSGNLSGAGTLNKSGANAVYLAGDNTAFAGTFSHGEGNVYLNNANAGSALAAWVMTGGNFLGANFAGDATIQFGTLSATTGVISVYSGTTGTKTYEIGARNEDFVISADIEDASSGTGMVSIRKIGTGIWQFEGTNLSNGETNIDNGTLFVAAQARFRGKVKSAIGGKIDAQTDQYEIIIGNYQRGENSAAFFANTEVLGFTKTFQVSSVDWIEDWRAVIRQKVTGTIGKKDPNLTGPTHTGNFPEHDETYFKIDYIEGLDKIGTNDLPLNLPQGLKQAVIAWEDWTDEDFDDGFFTVDVKSVYLDLEIDSDNNNGVAAPERSDWEETLEDHDYGLGKLVMLGGPATRVDIFVKKGLVTLDQQYYKVKLEWDGMDDAGVISMYGANEHGSFTITSGDNKTLQQLGYDHNTGKISIYVQGVSENNNILTLQGVEDNYAGSRVNAFITATFTGDNISYSDKVRYLVADTDSFYYKLQNNDEVRSALASKYTYEEVDLQRFSMQRLDSESKMGKQGIASNAATIILNRAGGFKANMYGDFIAGEKQSILAFAGTAGSSDPVNDNGNWGTETWRGMWYDWKTNGKQALGFATSQYTKATAIGELLNSINDKVLITGHSLGGGLASVASLRSGSNAHTYNAAGLSDATITANGGNDDKKSKITAYYNSVDVLSFVQDQISVLPNAYGIRQERIIDSDLHSIVRGEDNLSVYADYSEVDKPNKTWTEMLAILPRVSDMIDYHKMDWLIDDFLK